LSPLTRRELLRASALCTAGFTLGKDTSFLPAQLLSSTPSQAAPALTLDPHTLARYVDPLPIPAIARAAGSRIDPHNPGKRLPLYRMTMKQTEMKVHRDLHPTMVWGFEGTSPGPTFETRSGEGFIVEWINSLPQKHFLPIDHRLHGAESTLPEVRSVIHLHGGKTPPDSDGYPEDWRTTGQSLIYHYPNQQDACMLFYHDHAMGINRLNIYAGLFGLFLIRDAHEESLALPSGSYEIPLLIFDRLLTPQGELFYPVSGKPGSPWVPEVFGDAILINGRLFPYLEVEPRPYRLRIMNGSNGRFYRFSFGQKLPFSVIGTDQGFLGMPVPASRVVMAPAERLDVLFDFSAHAGEKIILRSDAFDLMEFRVAARKPSVGTPPNRTTPPKSSATKSNVAGMGDSAGFVRLSENQAVRTRRLTLDEIMDPKQQSMGMLLNNTPWHMPITEKPVLDTMEIWELVNLTEDSHPIHIHLVRFQILDRRPFDTFDFMDKQVLRFTGPALPPDPTEAGWKDTARADPGVVTRIIIPFTGFTGRYVWHCHILEHEDNEMMRPYEVVAAPAQS
jgi:spore coat protein A, manganese oxidase